MSWKSYAVVSGATVLAGWLASTPPTHAPEGTSYAPRQANAPRVVATSDIEREAERLRVRVRREVEYAQPQRNPFRFGAGRVDTDRGGDVPDPSPAPASPTPIVSVALPPPVKLAGIAEDENGPQMERTAILSSPAGVLLVHEGDPVLEDYRVSRIENEAVELVKSDGTILRLTLSNPRTQ